MFRLQFLSSAILAMLVVALFAIPAAAQTAYPRMPSQSPSEISQPKLSPYLNLLRDDNSVLSPYHTFVLPRRDQQQRQMWQAAELNRLQRTTAALAASNQASSNMSSRLPTGRGGRFQTTLHFYPMGQRP